MNFNCDNILLNSVIKISTRGTKVSESRRWCESGTGVFGEWIWEMPLRKIIE